MLTSHFKNPSKEGFFLECGKRRLKVAFEFDTLSSLYYKCFIVGGEGMVIGREELAFVTYPSGETGIGILGDYSSPGYRMVRFLPSNQERSVPEQCIHTLQKPVEGDFQDIKEALKNPAMRSLVAAMTYEIDYLKKNGAVR